MRKGNFTTERMVYDSPGSYRAMAEEARNLARVLQIAPSQESRRAALLRQRLQCVAQAAAELCDRWEEATDGVGGDGAEASTRRKAGRDECLLLLESLRFMATELAFAAPPVPQGISGILQAFAEKMLPDALLVLRPGEGYGCYRHVETFESTVAALETLWPLRCGPSTGDGPAGLVVLRYPYGEQDNVLGACVLMDAFRPHPPAGDGQPEPEGSAEAFAVWTLGPAYLFALVLAEEKSIAPLPGEETSSQARLRCAFEAVQTFGWFQHPHIGPLLAAMREQCHYDIGAAKSEDAKLADWPGRFEGLAAYRPKDFDRDVPQLWARLRQLLPPNELDMNAVEATGPANPISILNAGWSFSLLHMNAMYGILGSKTAEDRYEARQVLNRLLTKGVELSLIAGRWKAAREEVQ